MALEEGMALVDIVLAQTTTYQEDGTTVDEVMSFDTAAEANLEPSLSEGEENILRIKNKILAVNRTEDIVIGYDCTLKNNVLNIKLLKLVDGGTFKYQTPDDETSKIVGYAAPSPGTVIKRQLFDLSVYTAEKDTSGEIVGYVKFTFKNTKGTPVKYEIKDGEFFVPEMTLKSRPKPTEKPVEIDFVDTLPSV